MLQTFTAVSKMFGTTGHPRELEIVYDNEITSLIDIYFYE
jgi:hypothetical protein